MRDYERKKDTDGSPMTSFVDGAKVVIARAWAEEIKCWVLHKNLLIF